MARSSAGPLVAPPSGPIGGSLFRRQANTALLSTLRRKSQFPSTFQSNSRALWAATLSRWRSMSQAQQEPWLLAAQGFAGKARALFLATCVRQAAHFTGWPTAPPSPNAEAPIAATTRTSAAALYLAGYSRELTLGESAITTALYPQQTSIARPNGRKLCSWLLPHNAGLHTYPDGALDCTGPNCATALPYIDFTFSWTLIARVHSSSLNDAQTIFYQPETNLIWRFESGWDNHIWLYNNGPAKTFGLTPTTTAWHTLALVCSWALGNIQCFLDGAWSGTPWATNIPLTENTYSFALASPGAPAPLRGAIDDCEFLSRALSLAELQALHNSGDLRQLPLEAATNFQLRFDHGDGTLLYYDAKANIPFQVTTYPSALGAYCRALGPPPYTLHSPAAHFTHCATTGATGPPSKISTTKTII